MRPTLTERIEQYKLGIRALESFIFTERMKPKSSGEAIRSAYLRIEMFKQIILDLQVQQVRGCSERLRNAP